MLHTKDTSKVILALSNSRSHGYIANSIRMRLNIVLGLLLALLLITALSALHGMNTGQQAVTSLLSGEADIANQARAAEIAMLQAQRAEKDYLLRYKTIGFEEARTLYLGRVSEHVRETHQYLQNLSNHGVDVKNMQQTLNDYHAHFMHVVELYEHRGYVNIGLEGEFRQAAHTVEADIRQEHPQWLHLLLQLRRHEKDYLLRNDAIYIQRVQASVSSLKLKFKGLGDDQKYHGDQLGAYLIAFMDLVAISQEITKNIAVFHDLVHQLEPELEKIHQRGLESSEQVKQGMSNVAYDGKNIVLITSVLALLLGLIASIWLSRSIIHPIQSVSQATKKFAQGNMDYRAAVTGPKELKELAVSFNHMADELQRSLQEMEQFSYAASHDLQEPLRMVASYTQLLSKRYKGQLDARADKYIHFAGDGAKRMQVLINALLSYSRVGSKTHTVERIDSHTIVQGAIDNLDLAIEEQGATIKVSPLPQIYGDPSLLTWVLQNLIGNAIKYRSDASPVIHIEATEVKQMVQFSIRDNGLGIAPAFHERIFIIFQRLHERDKYEGTGLGLALAKKIIDHHGGHIWLESEEGQGSTFYFTLPLVPAEQHCTTHD